MLIKFITLILVLSISLSNGFSYPEEGVYVGINSNFISTIANDFTKTFNEKINSIAIPDISGSEGSDKYDFSSIKQSVQLGDFYYKQINTNQYQVGFNSITFTIHTNYKACVHKLVDNGKQIELCDHGDVTINSQATLSSTSDMTIDFSGSAPSITCSSTTINVPSNGINYDVHCTSKICDKTHDIRDKIEQQFIPQVQTSVTTAINGMVSKYEQYFATLRPLNIAIKGNDLYLNSEGYLVQSNVSNSLTPTMIYSINGGVVVKKSNGQYVYPSQSPSVLPTYKSVEEFSTDASVVLTPFFFESLVDATFDTSLPFEITESMVPSMSPVHLNTSDPFFQQTAPGLTEKYPNTLIDVNLNSPSSPSISINKTGILLISSINSDFYVDTNTKVFSVQFSYYLEVTPSLTKVSNGFNITASIDNLQVYAKVTNSIVGDVDPTGFIQIIQLLQGFIKLPMINFKNPLTTYEISSLEFSDNNQFIQILLNLSEISSNIKIKLN